MQGSQTSSNPWQDASSSIPHTRSPNTVYVVTEKMFGETFISVYSGLTETEIANNPIARHMSDYLDGLNTNSADIDDMQSRVSTALEEYKQMSTEFGGCNGNAAPVLFNLVDKGALPEDAMQRDLDICKSAVHMVDPQAGVDEATQALEAFRMT